MFVFFRTHKEATTVPRIIFIIFQLHMCLSQKVKMFFFTLILTFFIKPSGHLVVCVYALAVVCRKAMLFSNTDIEDLTQVVISYETRPRRVL